MVRVDAITVVYDYASTLIDMTPDVVADSGLLLRRGNWLHGPGDRTAQTGFCTFVLRNDARNSGLKQGYYTPGHANCRPGFVRGVRVLIQGWLATHSPDAIPLFTGKLLQVDVDPGLYGSQRTRCMLVDWIDELAKHDVREVGPQVNRRSDQLITTILDAMPASAQPVYVTGVPARDLDVGVDTYPYAFDDLGGGRAAMGLMHGIVLSELGSLYVKGDGTATFENRNAILAKSSQFTFSNTMRSLRVAGSLDDTYNRVQATIYPKRIGASTVVLFARPASDTPMFVNGETQVSWFDYRDPADESVNIGGTAFVSPVVATTDYTANAAADGSGADLTGSFTVTVTFFASAAKVTVTNGSGGVGYLTHLQGRGTPIFNLTPVTYQAESAQVYGVRTFAFDMPYQDDGPTAQAIVTYLEAQYHGIEQRVEEVTFNPQRGVAEMTAALVRDIGDIVTITEPVTAILNQEVEITGVQLAVEKGNWLTCTWSIKPALIQDAWVLQDPVDGILGTSTIMGGP